MLTRIPGWIEFAKTRIAIARNSPLFIKYKRYRSHVGFLIVTLSAGFLVFMLIQGWNELKLHFATMKLLPLFAGFIFSMLAFGLGGLLWHVTQKAFSLGNSWQKSMEVHILSNITKYAPGYAWQYVSKGYLANADSSSVGRITSALVTEVVLLFSPGLILAAFVAINWGNSWQLSWSLPSWTWLLIILVFGIATVGWLVLLNNPKMSSGRPVNRLYLLYGWLISMAGWLAYSIACWFYVASMQPIGLYALGQCAFALVIAATVSFLAIFVPGGFGIREMVLATLLSGLSTPAVGITVSLLMRFSVLFSELLSCVVVLLYKRLNRTVYKRLTTI